MRKLLRSIIGVALIALAGAGCASMEDKKAPYVVNPVHWGAHFAKIFGHNTGELHMLHLNIDRVVFGLDYFKSFENSESVYTLSD